MGDPRDHNLSLLRFRDPLFQVASSYNEYMCAQQDCRPHLKQFNPHRHKLLQPFAIIVVVLGAHESSPIIPGRHLYIKLFFVQPRVGHGRRERFCKSTIGLTIGV